LCVDLDAGYLDEELAMELAICLSANWLLLWHRLAKQAKVLPGVCVFLLLLLVGVGFHV